MHLPVELEACIIVDNDRYDSCACTPTWGLSIYINLKYEEESIPIIFDVGGDFNVWRNNFLSLNLSREIYGIFISHWHGDHAGALPDVISFLGGGMGVYVPGITPIELRHLKQLGGHVILCEIENVIASGVFSTGTMGLFLKEHALAVHLQDKGLAVFLGCSHPGLIKMVERAMAVSGVNRLYAVIGGFHMSSYTEGVKVSRKLKEYGARYISPIHCTGEGFRRGAREVFGEGFLEGGCGFRFKL